jgi:endonuclease-3 related protein
LYFDLLKKYGEPGPWPWYEPRRVHTYPEPDVVPGQFPSGASGRVPSTPDEIVVGAILTQNTNWRNVESALGNLRAIGPITIEQIYSLGRGDFEKLKALVRPSGFYNQKAEYLFSLSKYLIENFQGWRNFFRLPLKQARENLLAIKGIGKETADTILLYAGNKPIFVIDSYTKRFFKAYNLSGTNDYDNLQKLFVESLPKNLRVYQDYHALIVKWGKEN